MVPYFPMTKMIFFYAPGHLSARILEILRMSEIEALDLTASLMEVEGLNLGARELLPGEVIPA